jgi:hypothetical protein
MLQFASRAANAPLQTFDVATIQALSAWNTGLRGSLLANTQGVNIPVLQDFNALMYVVTSQLAYLMQEGIAEYDATTTYYTNSLVKKSGTTQVYKSLTDNNIGNALSNGTYWQAGSDLGGSNILPFPDYTAGVPVSGNTIYQAATYGFLLTGAETCNVAVGLTSPPSLVNPFNEGGGTYNVFSLTPIPINYYYKITGSPTPSGTFFPALTV